MHENHDNAGDLNRLAGITTGDGLEVLEAPEPTSSASSSKTRRKPDTRPPQSRHEGGSFELIEHAKAGESAGVYFTGFDQEGNAKAPLWVCAPLHIIAKTRGTKSADWGRLLLPAI
jgi:hypothetical protein